DDDPRVAGLHRAEHFLGAGHDNISAEHKVGAARGDAYGVNIVWRIGNSNMALNRAPLLRETCHVDHANAFAFKVRGHADDSANGDDPGATDSCNDDAVRMIGERHIGRGQSWPISRHYNALTLFELCPVHSDK